MSSNIPPESDSARNGRALRHLEQLHSLAVDDLSSYPGRADDGLGLILFEQWTKAHKAEIVNAASLRVNSGPTASPINWNCVFLTFMESCAMYLRNDIKLMYSVAAYREKRTEEALELYFESTSEIDCLAALWGMKFVMLCDLVDKHPVGHPHWNGPYCGAFYSIDPKAPFLGITFKGTTTIAGGIVDWNFQPVKGGDYLPGIDISEGMYTGLFTSMQHRALPNGTPSTEHIAFELIREGVSAVRVPNSTSETIPIHVTGHSLGAGYANLCYLAVSQTPFATDTWQLGDIYTFGSPRVGLASFEQAVSQALAQPGLRSSTRIVNNKQVMIFVEEVDIVTQVPPCVGLEPGPPATVFQHIDGGVAIYPNKPFEHLPREAGTVPSRWNLLSAPINHTLAHLPPSYYRSLGYILKTGGRSVIGSAEFSLSLGVASEKGVASVALASSFDMRADLKASRDGQYDWSENETSAKL